MPSQQSEQEPLLGRIVREAVELEGLAVDLRGLASRLRREPEGVDEPVQQQAADDADRVAGDLERRAAALREIAADIEQWRDE